MPDTTVLSADDAEQLAAAADTAGPQAGLIVQQLLDGQRLGQISDATWGDASSEAH
ncbi:hypothetical protein [Streptomyces xiamenensis]|uniref:hypothetical protein n=1 Tax=Streptomyces xiamenensis TaxID=408015 RepID=UPI003D725B1C